MVLWENYSKKKNIWELILAIYHFQRLTIAYNKNNFKKFIVIYFSIDTTQPISRPAIMLIAIK